MIPIGASSKVRAFSCSLIGGLAATPRFRRASHGFDRKATAPFASVRPSHLGPRPGSSQGFRTLKGLIVMAHCSRCGDRRNDLRRRPSRAPRPRWQRRPAAPRRPRTARSRREPASRLPRQDLTALRAWRWRRRRRRRFRRQPPRLSSPAVRSGDRQSVLQGSRNRRRARPVRPQSTRSGAEDPRGRVGSDRSRLQPLPRGLRVEPAEPGQGQGNRGQRSVRDRGWLGAARRPAHGRRRGPDRGRRTAGDRV